jgi:hypothetical protein
MGSEKSSKQDRQRDLVVLLSILSAPNFNRAFIELYKIAIVLIEQARSGFYELLTLKIIRLI